MEVRKPPHHFEVQSPCDRTILINDVESLSDVDRNNVHLSVVMETTWNLGREPAEQHLNDGVVIHIASRSAILRAREMNTVDWR